MSVDRSNSRLSSPDVRLNVKKTAHERTPDPFWPEMTYTFPVDPADIYDWAALIWEASEFMNLFDED